MKKKILIDSLVIIISVTLALFAENLREYFNERSYEKEIINSIKEDIIADTVQFNLYINNISKRQLKLDSVITYLHYSKFQFKQNDTISIDFLLHSYTPFQYTGAYNDLKYNYGTNLIQSSELRTEISSYYELRDFTSTNLTKVHQENQTMFKKYFRDNFDFVENDESLVIVRANTSISDFRNICIIRRFDLASLLLEFQTELSEAKQVINKIEKE